MFVFVLLVFVFVFVCLEGGGRGSKECPGNRGGLFRDRVHFHIKQTTTKSRS